MSDVGSLIERGGPAMIAIAAVALGGIGIVVERSLAIMGMIPAARRMARQARRAAADGDLAAIAAQAAAATHGLAAVLGRGVEVALRQGDAAELRAAMAQESRRLAMRLRRGLGLLATLGTMAPLLGLLGTVLGIMTALRDIGAKGQGGYEVVAVGVAEALITTAAGIVVAVVIVLLHQGLRARLSHVLLELQLLVEDLGEQLSRCQRRVAAAPPTSAAVAVTADSDEA